MQLTITFLGTGGSWPSPERNVPAIAIKRGKEVILFDCGEGTQRQLQRSNLSYMQITKIFITHFHGDHILGIPGLLQTMQLNDRKEKLYIYGPRGTKKLMDQLVSLSYFEPSYEVIAYDLRDKEILKFEGYSIHTRKVLHLIHTFAYALIEDKRPGKFGKEKALELGIPEGKLFGKLQRGESITLSSGKVITPSQVMGPPRKGRKITISGDTIPCKALLKLARESDVLIHDATFAEDFAEKANQYGHSTAKQAALVAKEAKVEKLYLVHLSPRYKNPAPLIDEARSVFEKSFVPDDLSKIEVRLKE
jgi:ribonuclease Z